MDPFSSLFPAVAGISLSSFRALLRAFLLQRARRTVARAVWPMVDTQSYWKMYCFSCDGRVGMERSSVGARRSISAGKKPRGERGERKNTSSRRAARKAQRGTLEVRVCASLRLRQSTANRERSGAINAFSWTYHLLSSHCVVLRETTSKLAICLKALAVRPPPLSRAARPQRGHKASQAPLSGPALLSYSG